MWLSLIFLFFVQTTFAQPTEAPNFLEGIKAYEAKEFDQAQKILSQLAAQFPENSVVLYNLGLTEYQLGNFGLALGLWRKARSLEPGLEEAEAAIAFTEERLFPDATEPPVYLSLFRSMASIGFLAWLFILCGSLFALGWFAIEFTYKKHLPFQQWPGWYYSFAPVLLIALLFTVSLAISENQNLATVVVPDLQTKTTPAADAPTLSELDEGQVVSVESRSGDWFRIRTERGRKGWVPQKSILMFKGF